MKLLFRRKSDGKILKPIQTLDSHVRLQNAAGNRVWWANIRSRPVEWMGVERRRQVVHFRLIMQA